MPILHRLSTLCEWRMCDFQGAIYFYTNCCNRFGDVHFCDFSGLPRCFSPRPRCAANFALCRRYTQFDHGLSHALRCVRYKVDPFRSPCAPVSPFAVWFLHFFWRTYHRRSALRHFCITQRLVPCAVLSELLYIILIFTIPNSRLAKFCCCAIWRRVQSFR